MFSHCLQSYHGQDAKARFNEADLQLNSVQEENANLIHDNSILIGAIKQARILGKWEVSKAELRIFCLLIISYVQMQHITSPERQQIYRLQHNIINYK